MSTSEPRKKNQRVRGMRTIGIKQSMARSLPYNMDVEPVILSQNMPDGVVHALIAFLVCLTIAGFGVHLKQERSFHSR